MTDDELDAIKARHERDNVVERLPNALPDPAHADRATLLAEIERLREALEDIARGDYSDPMCERTPEQRARVALEGKP